MEKIVTPDQITGHLIRDARRRKGIRQHQLAAAVGVQQNTVHQWEAGKRPISLDRLTRVAAALDVSPGTLVPTQQDIDKISDGDKIC